MRDDSPQTRLLIATLAGFGDGFVSYRPKLNEVTGSALGTLFLLRLLWRWEASGRRPFVRFVEPSPDRPEYRPGQSWCEDLHFARREYDQAAGAISTRLSSGNSVGQEAARLGPRACTMVFRWQDGAHRTWWQVVEPHVGAVIAPVFLRWVEPAPRPEAQPPAAQGKLLAGVAARPARRGGGEPKDPAGHIAWLMGTLFEVAGTYGHRDREAKGARMVAEAIYREEFPREAARDCLIDLINDTAYHGTKGWSEVLARMPSFLPRWKQSRAVAAEAARRRAENGGRPNLTAVPSVETPRQPPPHRQPAADRDQARLSARNYEDLER